MGYSIYVNCPNEVIQAKLLEFIRANYRDIDQVLGKKNSTYASPSTRGPEIDLSYQDQNHLAVGFDYNCTNPEHGYLWRLCGWMAAKLDLTSFWYDGDEEITLEELKADVNGFWPSRDPSMWIQGINNKTVTKRFRAEFARLDILWKEFLEKSD